MLYKICSQRIINKHFLFNIKMKKVSPFCQLFPVMVHLSAQLISSINLIINLIILMKKVAENKFINFRHRVSESSRRTKEDDVSR